MHRILAAVHKIKPALTPEEAWAGGAMGPDDIVAYCKGRDRTPNG